MNIQHLRYAVEVARTGSINKAAHCLLVAQPNLSRSIKDLEASLGVKLFDRSPLGMTMTPAGEEFVGYAARILSQIEEVENLYDLPFPHQLRSGSLSQLYPPHGLESCRDLLSGGQLPHGCPKCDRR